MMFGTQGDFYIFLLIAARVLALIEVAPLLSSPSIPQVAKLGLAGFAASAVLPAVKASGYIVPADPYAYLLLLIGEAMLGLTMGFFLSIVYSAFSTAGQFFTLQIGFSASEAFDPLAEIEVPVMGQFLNSIAMFTFIATLGFQKLFLIGVQGTFSALKAADLVSNRQDYINFMISAFGELFLNSLILAMPVLGTLLLVTVAMGLLSKAAPQINLLTEGFPVSLGVTFMVLMASMPFMVQGFSRIIDLGFDKITTIGLSGVGR